ncbi:MAG: hypothetical protein LBV71_12825 [Prevotella sp.]|jgi:hypothetical protein|nr:hypothetical protein [Prevotella sp.]
MKQNVSLNKFLIQLGLEKVVFFKDEEGVYSSVLHFDIQNKLKLISPDAIYIFNNQPLILFFDLTDNTDDKREDDIHKKVWSFDNSPIAFIIKSNEIKVYNALNYIKNENRLETINLTSDEIINKFSFWNLQSSNVWNWFQEKYIETIQKKETKKRVNERLFQNIRDVRNALIDKNNDPEGSIPNSLILRLIFIRYLIDRNIEIGSEFIDGCDTYSRRLSFSKLLQDPDKLSRLFVKLNDRFNGVLFKGVDIKLTTTQAESLSDIFNGEVPKKNSLFYGSDFYFEIFDFSIIPVEVISGIYESLIDPETRNLQSAVYTPSFLVEYILNDTIDVFLNENNTSECKIFEVAVGSGIFLVQSLRRMIEKEIELKGNLDKEAFSERIRDIAKQNLYGVDINKEALKVTCFSIYIALLDYQEPKNIYKYKFPNLLGENLFEANFFDTKNEFNQVINNARPQYILGNPPWKSNKDDYHIEWLKSNKKTVGRFEIAQSFLLRTKDFMNLDTKVALIITSTIFYNVSKTTRAFKNEFLSTYCISKFFDLSPVRRLIFEEKDSPASVVYYKLSENNDYINNVIDHQSVKINYFLKHFKMLVIEKYDKKKIFQRYFIEYDWMFKVALYGNTLDFVTINKIVENKSKINDYIDNKTIFSGDGILKGTPKPTPFSFLINLPIIENEEVKSYYTNVNIEKTMTLDDTYLESGRKLELFKGEHIYLKSQTLNESDIVVSYNNQTAVNRHDVITITSENEIDKLKEIYALLISDIHTYYQFLTSSAWGVSTRPAIRLKEYKNFPCVTLSTQHQQKLTSLINDFFENFILYYSDEIRSETLPVNKNILKNINKLINELYRINEAEKDLINYVLNVSRYQFQESKQDLIIDFTHTNKNDYRNKETVLKQYAEVFLREIEDIYDNEYIQAEIYSLHHFVAVNFVFHSDPIKERIIYQKNANIIESLEKLGNLSISQIASVTDPTKNLFIQKDIKGFEDNSFYIIKPNEYKCWHRAMAWYDVAEFKAKIEEAELEYLNSNEDE